MILRWGKLAIVWGPLQVVGRTAVVEVKTVWTVTKPEVVEEPVTFVNEIPVFEDRPVVIPRYPVRYVDKEVLLRRHNFVEKPYTVEVDRPEVREVVKPLLLERLKPEHREVIFPHYTLKPETREVPLDKAVVQVKCKCGNVYGANMTKCIKCGRTTADNIKEG